MMRQSTLISWGLVGCLAAFPSSVFSQDADGDGLSNTLEQSLLDGHRPILRYDSDESRWPISILEYVSHCALRWNSQPGYNYGQLIEEFTEAQVAADPTLILRGEIAVPGQPSSVVGHPLRNEWYLDINDDWRSGIFPGADGSNHRGMYGHCVPTSEGLILLQYWQFFPFTTTASIVLTLHAAA